MSINDIQDFQRSCFSNYLDDISSLVNQIPKPYIYPDGNPIKPVIPTCTVQNSVMLIGAFPSARFERRHGVLVPVGDNLSPFGHEEYFDGQEVRTQASRDILDKIYFPTLRVNPEEMWITDMVKIYLYPEKHIKNCRLIAPNIEYVNTHKLFPKIAEASRSWIIREIEICAPKLIITLGEVTARTISEDHNTANKTLLDGTIRLLKSGLKEYKIAHLSHPEIIRLNNDWYNRTMVAIEHLATQMTSL